MNNLKYNLFLTTVYLAVIFVFGLTDDVDRPIINFASYFYVAVFIAFPTTLFFPSITKIKFYIPMLLWAGIYMVVLQTIDRSSSTKLLELPVVILEFILLELGVWLAYRLAIQISQAESFLEAVALGAFPSRARMLDQEHQRIKLEFSRSRRYDRPLSLLAVEAVSADHGQTKALLGSIQEDLLLRFKSARVGQILDEYTRQTDIILKDHKGRFVILCPETNHSKVVILADRLSQEVKNRTDSRILCGVASFPEDALSFDDLVDKARERLAHSTPVVAEQLLSQDLG